MFFWGQIIAFYKDFISLGSWGLFGGCWVKDGRKKKLTKFWIGNMNVKINSATR